MSRWPLSYPFLGGCRVFHCVDGEEGNRNSSLDQAQGHGHVYKYRVICDSNWKSQQTLPVSSNHSRIARHGRGGSNSSHRMHDNRERERKGDEDGDWVITAAHAHTGLGWQTAQRLRSIAPGHVHTSWPRPHAKEMYARSRTQVDTTLSTLFCPTQHARYSCVLCGDAREHICTYGVVVIVSAFDIFKVLLLSLRLNVAGDVVWLDWRLNFKREDRVGEGRV